jgi:metal-dependent amidase/aminoacylase/carboxypeptidase family protein
MASMDVGTVGYTPGPALAAVDHFWITIRAGRRTARRPT